MTTNTQDEMKYDLVNPTLRELARDVSLRLRELAGVLDGVAEGDVYDEMEPTMFRGWESGLALAMELRGELVTFLAAMDTFPFLTGSRSDAE